LLAEDRRISEGEPIGHPESVRWKGVARLRISLGILMLIVPVQTLPSQTVQVQIGQQAVQLNIYQQTFMLAMDVYVNGVLIVGGVICQNLNRIIRSLYLGFNGDFAFFDTQGTTDPVYTGLGSRYLLGYFDADELTPVT
jgi:hypothetical protein